MHEVTVPQQTQADVSSLVDSPMEWQIKRYDCQHQDARRSNEGSQGEWGREFGGENGNFCRAR